MSLDNWASSGGWNTTGTKYTSAPYSFTDSPGGNYSSNSNTSLTLNNPVNLNGYLGAILEFQTQWDIEDNWDYAQVLISTNNGSSWGPLEGQYTNPGTGSFQPSGEPLFDGTQLSWVKETIDISDYINEEIKLRFTLVSDGSVQEDGIYIDDINLIVFEEATTNEEDLAVGVSTYSLEQNYPNPFNPATKIEYKIQEAGLVLLRVYNVLGKEVATLVNEEKAIGNHNVTFDAGNLPSGIYFYTIKAGKFTNTKKMILLK